MKEMIYKNKREIEILLKDEYKGFNYFIVSLGTHPCAYIEIPANHKYFKKNYNEIDIECNGGLTYSSSRLLDDTESWFIGWDYAHYGDYIGYEIPMPIEFRNNDKKWTTKEILEEVKQVIEQLEVNELEKRDK